MSSTGQPLFVVLEGLDGTGTTTQARLLADLFAGRDLRVLSTSEPSDGPIGRVLRQHLQQRLTFDPHTAALAFSADRADHLERVIRPALRDGVHVVCDRYLLSTLAYQGAEGVDMRWIWEMSRSFETPDLTVVLEVDDTERQTRVRARGPAERYERPDLAPALRASYDAAIELLRAHGHPIRIVNGARPPGDVAADVRGCVLGALDAPR